MNSATAASDNRALLKRALLKLDELQANLGRLREPIAIVGMSCRFPAGANDPEALWRILRDGTDGIGEIPADRWDVDAYYDSNPGVPGKMYTRRGGFLDSVDRFDPHFFGISPREVLKMDPQQRLLLEVVWEALERGGQAPAELAGSRTGVFVGIGGSDYAQMQIASGDAESIDPYFAAGAAHSIASGRISYLLGLQGPSVSVDTACSSSLLAVHLACQSLRLGECDMTLAGGVNLILSPNGTIAACQTRMLSPDGRCKTFAAGADGYVRAEGCAIVALKRLSDAKANGDNILALIRGTAANQDGRSNGLTAPNGSAQEAVIREALANAGVKAAEVSYLETHGTGTSLGDPIEVQALGVVLGKDRPHDEPVLIGAVKSNIGHLEAAAGIAGLVKVILALQHKQLPPSLHVKKLSPHIAWEQLPVKVVSELVPWPPAHGKRIAGVSSFGFSGTNVHVVVEEAPPPAIAPEANDRPLHILSLSAKSGAALRELSARFTRHLAAHPAESLADVCFTASAGRSHFNHRLGALAASPQELSAKLSAFAAGEGAEGLRTGTTEASGRPEIAFIFTGQGAQYAGMGRRLYETQPTFRKVLDDCVALLRPSLDQPLLAILYSDSSDGRLNETYYAQPALFAMEYALAELWRSWGVQPAAVMGHGVGEYAAACVAGVFSLEDGLRLTAERGRLMQALPKNGSMAVVFADEQKVAAALAPFAAEAAIAALNGPENTVISGARQAIGEILAGLKQEGIKSQTLPVSHAIHSPLIAPMLGDFERAARAAVYAPARIAMVSNLTGRLWAAGEAVDARYWRRHAREPVQFARGIESLHQQGCRIFVEIGPDATLLNIAHRSVPGKDFVWLASLRYGHDDWQQMLETLAALYTQGVDVDWPGFDRGYARRRVVLPVYPFERERYWPEASEPRFRVSAHQLSEEKPQQIHPLLGRRLRSASKQLQFENQISLESHPFLKDHQFFGTAVFPGAAYIEMTLAAATQVFKSATCSLENVNFREALLISEGAVITMQLIVIPEGAERASFEVYSVANAENNERAVWKLHVTGKMAVDNRAASSERVSPEEILARCQNKIAIESYYQMLADFGVTYGPGFRGIESLSEAGDESLGRVGLSATETKGYRIHPALLDACLQVFGAKLFARADLNAGDAYMPITIDRVSVHQNGKRKVWSYVVIQEGGAGSETIVGNLRILGDGGELIADIEGVHFKRISRESLLRATQKRLDNWIYEVAWQPITRTVPAAVPQQPNRRGRWIVLADDSGVGANLAELFEQQKEKCVLVFPTEALERLADGHWRINPECPEDFERLVKEVGAHGELHGVIHLWGLGSVVSEKTTLAQLHHDEMTICGSALHLVQALVNASGNHLPRLWLVTRGAQPVNIGESPSVLQASLWGLGAVISLEHPALGCTRIDLDPDCSRREDSDVVRVFEEIRSNVRENQIAIRRGQSYAARFQRCRLGDENSGLAGAGAKAEPQRLDITKRGSLDNLKLAPMTRRDPGRGEVEIKVVATGLNFRDVLNTLDLYPGDAGRLGNECVGKVVRVGVEVKGLKIGDEVVAVAADCFANYITTKTDFVLPKPALLTAEEAATIPIAFLTAHYALHHLGRMSKGDRVLIHAAAGGVGMAAVQLAQRAGAEIFATAGSPEKRGFLKSLGVQHVMDSRSLAFADEIMQIADNGIDIVLNSLTGDSIPKSLAVLRAGGRFLEIGKNGIWDEDKVKEVRPDVSYHVIYLGQTLGDEPALVRSLFCSILESIAKRDLKPLPLRAFTLENAIDAFRYMARARHIGKLVITQTADGVEPVVAYPVAPLIDANACYLVTGGLGALGLHVAKWLVDRGARNLLLAGRRDPSTAARAIIDSLQRTGARIHTRRCDISRHAEVRSLLDSIAQQSMPPLRGVVHAAGVLDDDTLLKLNWQRFSTVMAPKIDGSWNLYQLTKNLRLDFFVLFSSLAPVFGNAGQGNYAAANSFLDALAHHLRALGVPSLSINWSAWADTGMAAALGSSGAKRMTRFGMSAIAPGPGMETMARLLHNGCTQATVAPIEWRKFLSQIQSAEVPRFFSEIAQAEQFSRDLDDAPGESVAASKDVQEGADPERSHQRRSGTASRNVARLSRRTAGPRLLGHTVEQGGGARAAD